MEIKCNICGNIIKVPNCTMCDTHFLNKIKLDIAHVEKQIK